VDQEVKYDLNIEISAQPAEVFGELNLPVPTVKRMRASMTSETKEGCQAAYAVAWSLVMNKRCWIRTMEEPKCEVDHETKRERWSAYIRLHFIDEDGPREMVSPTSTQQVVYMDSGKLK